MPTATYIALSTITLGSAAADVTFSSIPATYRDLRIIVAGAISASGSIVFQLNGDTGNNYTIVGMTGSTTGGVQSTSLTYLAGAIVGNQQPAAANTQLVGTLDIMDYSATDKHKTALGRGNAATGLVDAQASRWANTNAVTSVKIFNNAGNLNSGMVISLYGIIS